MTIVIDTLLLRDSTSSRTATRCFANSVFWRGLIVLFGLLGVFSSMLFIQVMPLKIVLNFVPDGYGVFEHGIVVFWLLLLFFMGMYFGFISYRHFRIKYLQIECLLSVIATIISITYIAQSVLI